jgi:hypothetical protein
MLDTRLNNSNHVKSFDTVRPCNIHEHVQHNYITSRHSNMYYNNTTTTQHSLVPSVSHDEYLYIDSITTPQQPVLKTL